MKRILSALFILSLFLPGFADDKPSFPGGEKALNEYLQKNIRYPEAAKENGVEGIVAVGFIVMPDGSLQQVKVIKFIDPDLEQEAIRVVVGMPAWIPAEQDGVAVEAPAKVDIPFILE
ncbi:MAG: TonB family protein [Muribaculaceae bacterium]|nr:TonB family protein [Muribaculaceae bacterium]